ncbi:MAG: DUF262 domain-containing protein [Alphaproteobacteria bacterium]|nr:DUF262 domain-containing protein [Alphaproteobacteria bacterium]
MLPRFQRFEAWTDPQIANLLNTVLQGLPCGAVLTLEVAGSEPFVSRPVAGPTEGGERVSEHLLDGQQRLTALWRCLNDDYENRTYLIQVGPDEETGEPYTAVSMARWSKDGSRYPLWLEQPARVWERGLIPIRLLRPGQDAEEDLRGWAREATDADADSMLDIVQKVNRLRGKFASYNIPFLSLPSTTDREIALDVFIRMNTSASPLSDYDIVVAQVEAATEFGLHDLVDMLSEKAPNLDSYGNPADIMLAIGALLQDRTPTKSSYLSRDFAERLIRDWEKIELGAARVVRFLEEEKIFDSRRLPSDVVLHSLAALWAHRTQGLDAEGEARNILRKYLWRAVFTERYDRTSANRALADVRSIEELLSGNSEASPPIFDESQYGLPNPDILKTAGWPNRKDRLARGILAISLRCGGIDFADGSPVSRDHLKKREYHHLFPRAWLRQTGVPEQEANTALNCALVTWKTNRALADKSPSEYMSERAKKSSLGDAEIEQRLRSHLIPDAELVSDDYAVFRDRRAEELCEVMMRLCEGQSI